MEFESTIKKNLWIFFQMYGFIRKIEPFHLRMKHNIIQMTATVDLTVPLSINPIFQYIFDCLGKRLIRSISKIVPFGAQKIQTSSLRSRCTHNEWLFCFVTVNGEHYRAMLYEFLFPKIWRGWYGWHLVSTGRGHLPHSQRNNRSFAHRFQKSNQQPKF